MVTGSGERVLALLSPELQQVYAIDINPEAQYLLELKLAALRVLEPADYLRWLGHTEATAAERRQLLPLADLPLTDDCRRYWTENQVSIDRGLLQIGHFERFLARIRPLLRPFLGKGFRDSFRLPLAQCSHFPHRRWRLLVWLFGQRWVYKLMGNRDIAFIAPDGQIELIPQAFDRILQAGQAHRSFLHHLVFNGHLRDMPAEDLPISLQINHLQNIKNSINNNKLNIHYATGDLKTVIEAQQLYFDDCLYSVSDMLSFVDFDYLEQLVAGIRASGKTKTHLVCRSFLRGRLQATQLDRLRSLVLQVNDSSEADRSGNYQIIHLQIR